MLHCSQQSNLSLGKPAHTHLGELIAEIRLTRKHVSLHAACRAGRVENPAKSLKHVCGFHRKADRLSLLNRSDLTAYIGTKDAVLGKIPRYTSDSFPFDIDFSIYVHC